MPVFLEPDKRFPIVLDSDMDKPKEVQPTFFAESKSMRAMEQMSAEYDAIHENVDSAEEMNRRVVTMLHKHIVGWKNMGGYEFPKTVEEWHDSPILTYQEARELLRKVMWNQRVQHEEKKS